MVHFAQIGELSTLRALGSRGRGVSQDGLPREDHTAWTLPAANEPADVLHLQRTIDSLERENAWLKAQLARMVRDK
jgi:hypothetical protein